MPRDQDRRRWLTRTEAAKRIGISIAAVRQLEGERLFPETIAGIVRFRPSEIAALRKSRPQLPKPVSPKPGRRPRQRTPGEEAASVFALFAERKDLRAIVTTLHVSPERVRMLYHHWLVGLETGERLRQPKLHEPPPIQSRKRAQASVVRRRSSPSPTNNIDGSAAQPQDLAASSLAVTALVEKLLGNR